MHFLAHRQAIFTTPWIISLKTKEITCQIKLWTWIRNKINSFNKFNLGKSKLLLIKPIIILKLDCKIWITQMKQLNTITYMLSQVKSITTTSLIEMTQRSWKAVLKQWMNNFAMRSWIPTILSCQRNSKNWLS
jgi:hypothetical protein